MMKSNFYLIVLFCLSFILTKEIYPQFSYDNSEIKEILSSVNFSVYEYKPAYTDTSLVRINNSEYRNLVFNLAALKNPYDFGLPEIPVRTISLGVPDPLGNTIQVLDVKYKYLSGKPKPIAKPVKKDSGFEFVIEESSAYSEYEINLVSKNESEIIEFGDFGISRGLGIQTFIINAVQYLPIENKIRIIESITFKIGYNPNNLSNFISSISDELLEYSVINYNIAKKWIKRESKLNKTETNNSVLSQGKWVRFEASEEGIYKINKSTFASMGFDANNIDPRKIRIFNNGGSPLSELINAPKSDDLIENAILVEGEEDGVFNENDYILFYGRGVDFWHYDSLGRKITRSYNPYSLVNYYWITVGGENGKRIGNLTGLNSPSPKIKNRTTGYAHWEVDKINVGKSGRLFMGDDFSASNKSRTYTTYLDGLVANQPVRYSIRFLNSSSPSVPFLVEENGNTIINTNLYGYGSDDYSYGYPYFGSATYNGNIADSRSVLRFTYSPTVSSSYGYLDYFEIYYTRELKANNAPVPFYSDNDTGLVEYQLYNFASSNIYVFDVSDFKNIKRIVNPVSHSGGEFRFQVYESTKRISKYLALTVDDFKTPNNFTEIKNQNIRGNISGSKLIIITHKDLLEQAERLKKYRESEAKIPITTSVYTQDEIFNEFSSGNTDVTALRDFIKFAYEKWTIKPEYVLLFGDGDYDARNIEKLGKNFVLTYQTLNSHEEIYSYCMDDYFVMVEGEDVVVDLGIGRITAQTLTEASNVINKIIKYESTDDYDTWRNLITLVADDQTISSGYDTAPNTIQSENLAHDYIPPSYDLNKIYLVSYPTVQTSLGRRKPGVNQAIIDAVNNGTVVMNYVGHGSPEVWAHEMVFVKSTTIPQFRNNKYFFLTAATCDFGYFDNPNSYCASEEILLKANSGSIGVFTAVRPVFSNFNADLNQEFYLKLLQTPRDTMNFPVPIGKAYFLTKIRKYGTNDQKYMLFGDPALRLNIPRNNAVIDSINGMSADANIQIKALGKSTVKGSIRKSDNSVWDTFNGEAVLTVYDSERRVPVPEVSPTFQMIVIGGIIFKGKVSVSNGYFSTDFVVPKDISYENKNGKIVIYVQNFETDGLGFNNKVIIGGTDSTIINDGKGPEITITFDDIKNIGGYLINPNSYLIVDLKDETGLNTTGSGVGHKIEAILDENDSNPVDLTNYFSGDLDAGGKSGKVKYLFGNLPVGNHNIKVKAWDVFNNFSSEEEYFKVVSGNNLVVDNVYNYPNPFSSYTTFTFQHNISQPVNVKIKIYTIAGRLINEIERLSISDDRFVKIDWDGNDKDGGMLANGTYLYKLIVESIDGNFKESVLGKIVKMN